ncbi:MAG: hypothetical protein ACERKZ_06125 [Lachnotalea sp.]
MAILCLAAVFKLRKIAPNMERPYKVLFPIIPIIASISCGIVAIATVMSQGTLIVAAIITYIVAAIYYAISQKNYEATQVVVEE